MNAAGEAQVISRIYGQTGEEKQLQFFTYRKRKEQNDLLSTSVKRGESRGREERGGHMSENAGVPVCLLLFKRVSFSWDQINKDTVL